MTTFSGIRVLGPGASEAQEKDSGDSSNSISRAHGSIRIPYFRISVTEQTVYSVPRNAVSKERLESAAHNQIEIGSLLDNRLRMREPLTLEIESEGEFYIAKCEELNEFGYGYDPINAVQDIRNTIAELYWELKENQERLGVDLAKTWRRLSGVIYEA